MPTEDRELDPTLIDLYLVRCAAGEVGAAIDARQRQAPQLSRDGEILAEAFSALDELAHLAPPAGLEERVRARVAAAALEPRAARPRFARVPGGPLRRARAADPRDGVSLLRLQSFRDFLAVAALIVFAVGVGVPSLLHVRDRNRRIVCASNLARLGQAVQAYASIYHDSLPFVGWSGRSTWRPTADPNFDVLPNRRHVFPLLSAGMLPTSAFVCPGSNGVAMPATLVGVSRDFADPRNVSYAYQNMAGVRPSLRSDPETAILGDDNPLFEDGVPLIDALRQGVRDPALANSRSHRGAGQNILTLDGRSLWATSPLAGVGGDNIWTLDRVRDYTGREGPQSLTDSHLIK